MKLTHQSPWMNLYVSAAAAPEAPATARIVIEGYIGWDPEKWWDGEAQTGTKEYIRKELAAIEALKVAEIEVVINSLGGSVLHGLSIHDLLAQSAARVTTTVEGMTASAATLIAQAGDVRRMSENALYLVHQPMTVAAGNISEIMEAAQDLEAVQARLLAVYTSRSGKTDDEVRAVMYENYGHGRWLDASEALAFGFIDEAFAPRQIAAAVGIDSPMVQAFRLPPIPEDYAARMSPPTHNAEQTSPSSNADTSAGQTDDTEQELTMDKQQIATLKARFGAEFALSAVETDMDFADALAAGSEQLGNALTEARQQITDITAERDTLQARVTELEDAAGDPLTPSEPRELQNDDDEPPAPPPSIADAYADLVASGKTPAEAWAELRTSRPEDYAAHFSMG